MARRHSGIRFVRPAKSTKIWVGNGLTLVTLVTGTAQLISVFNADLLALRPFTILRSRIELMFRSDQIAGSESPTGAYGKIVVKDQAIAAGIASLPSPITEPEAEWFIYQPLTDVVTFADATGYHGTQGVRYVVDSKAMRKIGINEQSVGITELRTAGGALLNVEGRTLVQVH